MRRYTGIGPALRKNLSTFLALNTSRVDMEYRRLASETTVVGFRSEDAPRPMDEHDAKRLASIKRRDERYNKRVEKERANRKKSKERRAKEK